MRITMIVALALVPSAARGDEPAPAPAAAPSVAAADTPEVAPPSSEAVRLSAPAVSRGSARSQANDWLLLPGGGVELGAELSFMTADTSLGAMEVKFTDVAFLRPHVRWSIKGAVELAGGVSLLAKQPSYVDESPLQGGWGNARVGFGKRYAVGAGFAAGPLLGGDGIWYAADAGLQAKKSVHSTVSFEGAFGWGYVALQHDATAIEDTWFAEVSVGGTIQLHSPRGEIGIWAGADFHFPVAHADAEAFDPQTRLNFQVGMVYALIAHWDLFLELAVIDRGDLVNPETTLPILDGGFDQQQVVFGVVRRFGVKEESRYSWLAY